MADSTKDDFILLLGVEEDLFKTCFGDDTQWPCKLDSLSEGCTNAELEAVLAHPGLKSVVVQDDDLKHWDSLVKYYNDGGLLIYFGIYGVYSTPSFLSKKFGLDWNFSGYTKYEFMLTPAGIEVLGDGITKQQYTKSNLLHVPEKDRIMIPMVYNSYEEFKEDCCESDDDEEQKRGQYEHHQMDLAKQVPLAMHRSESGGGIAYLGFVNGDGGIPEIVRALCTRTKTS